MIVVIVVVVVVLVLVLLHLLLLLQSRTVVLNLGSIEPQGFGESVSGVRR